MKAVPSARSVCRVAPSASSRAISPSASSAPTANSKRSRGEVASGATGMTTPGDLGAQLGAWIAVSSC